MSNQRPLSRNVDLVGLTVGQLTVVAFDRVEGTKGRLWLCACACGKQAIRTSSALMRAHRHGLDPACRECTLVLRRGWWAARHDAATAALAAAFDEHGSLYGLDWDDDETDALRDQLADELGFAPDEPAPEAVTVAASPDWPQSAAGQDWSALFPISGDMLACRVCRKHRDRGWVCVDCVGFVCLACGRAERHSHHRQYPALTAEQIHATFQIVMEGAMVQVHAHRRPAGFFSEFERRSER